MDSRTCTMFNLALLVFLIACGDSAASPKQGKSALIIIDVQNCFTPGGTLEVHEGDQVIPVINEMRKNHKALFDMTLLSQDWHCATHVSFASQYAGYSPSNVIELNYNAQGELCRDQNVTNNYTVDCPGAKTPINQVLWPDHCINNSTDAEFNPQLNMEPSDIIIQKGTTCHLDSYSAFYDNGRYGETQLDSLLKKNDIKNIYVTGLATDYCVYWTSKDGKSLGYNTHVVVDATRGVAATSIKAALADMDRLGIHVINSTDVKDPEVPVSRAHTRIPAYFTILFVVAFSALYN